MITANTLQVVGPSFLLGDDVNTDINCSNKYLPGKDVAYVEQHAFEQLSPKLENEVQANRSEERRVGKECRSRGSAYD